MRRRFNVLPATSPEQPSRCPDGLADAQAARCSPRLRCVAAAVVQVGSDALTRVMQRLPLASASDLVLGFDAADDASVVRLPPDCLLVQSIDHFRAFIDDPYLFARIAANHALGDLYAMGRTRARRWPWRHGAVRGGADMEQTLYERMSGALACCTRPGHAARRSFRRGC